MKQHYTGSFSYKMQFYTDSTWGNPTPVPSLSDEVLHWLILRQPYIGSSSVPRCSFTWTHYEEPYTGFSSLPRWSFTRTRPQETLHWFLLSSKTKFYTDLSPYPDSSTSFTRTYPELTLPGFLLTISRCSFNHTHPKATLPGFLLTISRCSFT